MPQLINIHKGGQTMELSMEDVKRAVSSFYSARGLFIPASDMTISITVTTRTLLWLLLKRLWVYVTAPLLLVPSVIEVMREGKEADGR